MERINLNHWFVGHDSLSISFMNYCVLINICFVNEIIFYKLEVIDSNRERLILDFYSLEEAISFAEVIISKSNTLDEMFENYNVKNKNKKIRKK